MMAEGYGQWNADGLTRRVIALSQEQLSQMLSISRQTTNQILKDLEARQLVRVQRRGRNHGSGLRRTYA